MRAKRALGLQDAWALYARYPIERNEDDGTTNEILSTPACATCVATKFELTRAAIAFREVKAVVDPDGAADMVRSFAEVNRSAGTSAPLVPVSDENGDVLDHWAGRVKGVIRTGDCDRRPRLQRCRCD
ncbi:hypothetical protein ABW18_11185 [Gordonia jacobaea]|uniref:Uncharacterized protein n=1 Tax=Gordonia jacobaea TaxID=122202 RepID=A0ABR5IDA5_9ACTN|nr:hypothetical protein ABW18_11185 [Gordonia jacobaea]